MKNISEHISVYTQVIFNNNNIIPNKTTLNYSHIQWLYKTILKRSGFLHDVFHYRHLIVVQIEISKKMLIMGKSYTGV